jgi:hypothetical protein
MLSMFYARQDFAFRCAITLQLIGDNHTWDVLEPYAELPKKSFRRLCVPSALDQDIQHVAILVYGSPEIMRFPVTLQVHLIQMPFVATTRATTTEFIGVRLPERANTIAERFHSSRRFRAGRRPLFHIAKTQ